MIGPEISCHHPNPSDAKLKTIAAWSLTFSRASGDWYVITFSFLWWNFPFIWLVVTMFAAGFTTLIREASDLDQPWTSLNKVAWWLYDKNGSVVMYITWSAFFSALTSSLALRWISSFLIGFNGSLELPRRAKMLVPRACFENPSSALIAPQNKVQSWEANSAYPLVRRKHVLYVAESASRLRELFPPNVTDEWCVVGATKLNIVE